MASVVEFRFDPVLHEYFNLSTGDLIPNITSMLEQTGYIDTTWFTEEGSDRGTESHDLTAEYDLGALVVQKCASSCRVYLLGWVAAMQAIRPTWQKVEEPNVHQELGFGGRPDRVGRVYSAKSVCELKTGESARWHRVQTALQAILEADYLRLPPKMIDRYVVYVNGKGKWSLEQHPDARDVDEAMDVIRACC